MLPVIQPEGPPPGIHRHTARDADAGDRLDRRIASWLPGLSRSRAKALIEDGRVSLVANGEKRATLADASRKVKVGEIVEIDVPESAPASPEAQAIDLTILHEDADLIVLDKPAGLVVHPAPGNPDRTLVNALLAHCGDSLSGIGGVRRPGIVHRLDKDTSGVMVVAKNDRAHHALSEQFQAHSIERAYRAVVHGAPIPSAGAIEGNIGRHRTDRKRMAVVASGGKPATTRYRVLERFGDPARPIASLVEAELLTGRTHQVRVHFAHRGHPLIGDPVYGRGRAARGANLPAFGRQALHAFRLGFVHPRDGSAQRFESPLPQDLDSLLQILRI
jgi:23S rRNA pseudouridine1911/1915/1917 synthase